MGWYLTRGHHLANLMPTIGTGSVTTLSDERVLTTINPMHRTRIAASPTRFEFNRGAGTHTLSKRTIDSILIFGHNLASMGFSVTVTKNAIPATVYGPTAIAQDGWFFAPLDSSSNDTDWGVEFSGGSGAAEIGFLSLCSSYNFASHAHLGASSGAVGGNPSLSPSGLGRPQFGSGRHRASGVTFSKVPLADAQGIHDDMVRGYLPMSSAPNFVDGFGGGGGAIPHALIDTTDSRCWFGYPNVQYNENAPGAYTKMTVNIIGFDSGVTGP